MKFHLRKPGEERIIRKFAILPITIGPEVRWFEMVTVRQKYQSGSFNMSPYWLDIEFIDKE